MDQSECHNLQSLNQFITSQFLKKLTQLILLSISVFSFFFSYSSWYSFFLHSFKVLTMDKNYIFLICNGILVFLAKTSGLFKKIGDGDGLQSASEKEVSLETTEPLENVVEEVEEEEFSMEGESEDSNLIVEDKDQQEEPIGLLNTSDGEEEGGGITTTEDEENNVEEEEEEEEDGLLSTEELNKKFDEFIRRMKEEIRIGAQQQLVMVQ